MPQYQLPGGGFVSVDASRDFQTADGGFLAFLVSGAVYDESIAETASASDAIASALLISASISEAGSATDQFGSGTVQVASVAEAVTVVDAVDAVHYPLQPPPEVAPRRSTGPRLLLFEDMPLRTTRMLGDFAEDVPLAHVFGDLSATRFPLIRLSDTRWFASEGVIELGHVYVDDQRTDSWALGIESDASGHTWTVATLGAPAPASAKVSATGKGLRDPRTGALVENPADIMEYVSRLAGRDDKWQALREQCAVAGLRVGGRISAIKSIRAQLDEIAQSVAAIWAPGVGSLYPTTEITGVVLPLHKQNASGLSVSTQIDDTADVLRLAFDVSDATGKAQQYIELTASPKRYGGIDKQVVYPWLRNAANAEAVGRRILTWLACRRYNVTFTTSDRDVKPGRWGQFVGHPEWPLPDANPHVMVMGATSEHRSGSSTIDGVVMLDPPAIKVTAHSIALPDTVEAGLDVSTRNGVATFIVYDKNRQPVKDSRVSFDGGAPKTSDAQGRVSFPYTPGQHELAIEAPGKISQILTITL